MTSRSGNAPLLCRANLPRLPASVEPPGYDLARLTTGIAHLGLGGFHRAHMARYTHDLMELDPDAAGWGIVGAVLLPRDRRTIESLGPQDGLYTLLERDGDHERVRVIGSLAGLVFAGETSGRLLGIIDDPAIRIVSLTVTENGYCLDAATKRLDPSHESIKADLRFPALPRSAVGVITEALRRRRAAGLAPFTVLSCDNIQKNGDVVRAAVLDLARLQNPESDLARWIELHVSFPSTMVDRITPVTAPSDIEHLESRTGLADAWPVVCETFTQWVIEDRFPAGRPAWERVGAQFVEDVEPYEKMKLRLLNASHLAVAGLGYLSGYVTIAETMADPRIASIMTAMMDRETGPTLPPIPDIDLAHYKRTLVRRFSNSAIQDTVERVNTDAPLNILLDPIRDRLAAGASIEFLALALAAWLRRVRGENDGGVLVPVRHQHAELLRAKAIEGGPNPYPLLAIRHLFGELGEDWRVRNSVGGWLAMLYSHGTACTLNEAALRAHLGV